MATTAAAEAAIDGRPTAHSSLEPFAVLDLFGSQSSSALFSLFVYAIITQHWLAAAPVLASLTQWF